MKRLIFVILLWLSSCHPCPAQDYPSYWKLQFDYIGSRGAVSFPQGRFWLLPDTIKYQADTISVLGSDTLTISHGGDSTHYATTASMNAFDKPVKATGGFIADSTTAVFKFWFKRNDTTFAVVGTDTLYWPKKP